MKTIPEASRRFYRLTVAFPTLFAANEARSAVRHAMPAHAAIVPHSASEPVRVRSRWLVSVTVDGAAMQWGAHVTSPGDMGRIVARALGGAFRAMGSARADADAAHAAAMRRDASPAARADAADAVRAAAAPTAEPSADAILAASIAGNSYALWHCAGRTDAPPTFATDAERDAYRAAYEETQANEAAALERARTAPAIVPNVHVMATSGEPTGAHYNETQMNGDIRDGDVLIIGETVAILDRAWPVAIVGPCGAFHAIGDGAGDDVCDADRARSGRAPLAPIIARIRAGEFTPAER